MDNTEEAFNTLKNKIQTDPDYAWSWHCNLAMPMIDAGCPAKEANHGAARAMSTIFGVDTSQNPNFADAQGIAD